MGGEAMKPKFQFIYGDETWLVWEAVWPVGGLFPRISLRRADFWRGPA